MTLGLVFSSPLFAATITDRRLTVGVRRQTDDWDKSGVVVYRDARLAYTLCGLAQVTASGVFGKFDAREWLAKELAASAEGAATYRVALANLARAAAERFGKLPRGLTSEQRLFTVAFTGYETSNSFGLRRQVIAVVTNRGSAESEEVAAGATAFDLSIEVFENECRFFSIGSGRPSTAAVRRIEEFVSRPAAPPPRFIELAVEAIREVASMPNGHTVGGSCSSVLIGTDEASAAQFDYHPDERDLSLSVPTYVYARWDEYGAYSISASRLVAQSSNPADIGRHPVPPQGGACACGSGKRYKRCHGRAARTDLTGSHAKAYVYFNALPTDEAESVTVFAFMQDGVMFGPDTSPAFMRVTSHKPPLMRAQIGANGLTQVLIPRPMA